MRHFTFKLIKINKIKNSVPLTLATFQVFNSHMGWHRYRTFSSLLKVLLDSAAKKNVYKIELIFHIVMYLLGCLILN